MKKFLVSILALTLILTVLTGCNTVMEGFNKGIDSADTGEVQTITSSKSGLSLDFPESWKTAEMNELATIQMALMIKEQYMMVIEEAASDFEDDFTVGEYSEIIMKNMKAALDAAEGLEIKDATVATDLAAKQFELAGSVEKVKIKYFVTCVKNDGVFYQFISWSIQSKYDEAKPVFENILKSITF